MLIVSRIEGHRLEIKCEKQNLFDIVKQTFNEIIIRAKAKKINLELSPNIGDMIVNADKDELKQVVENITDNALKFTPHGGKIKIFFARIDGMLEVHISDTGPGIAPKDIPRLFQKFEKLTNIYSKNAEVSGTGLGLYIAKQIITLHQGKIWVNSKEGRGSTFIFSLPQYQVEKAYASPEKENSRN